MTLLYRYLIKNNLFLILIILSISSGIYILTDLFERMDKFFESGLGVNGILIFYLAKIPSIISQLLPAVFLLSLVLQLNFLQRSRELLALNSGGISLRTIMYFILLYGILWSTTQLFFSQFLGVRGERYTYKLWREKVGKNDINSGVISGIWFTEKKLLVHLDSANTKKREGSGLMVYELSDDNSAIKTIFQAQQFKIGNGKWELYNGFITKPEVFSREKFSHYTLAIKQNLQDFALIESTKNDLNQLSLWELAKVAKRNKKAGSNIEKYIVSWHSKLAYAASIVVMGLFALAISLLTENIYKAVFCSLLIIFTFYNINTLLISIAEMGRINPFLGAWLTNILAFTLSLTWILYPYLSQRLKQFFTK